MNKYIAVSTVDVTQRLALGVGKQAPSGSSSNV
jgi:hypothetical protein